MIFRLLIVPLCVFSSKYYQLDQIRIVCLVIGHTSLQSYHKLGQICAMRWQFLLSHMLIQVMGIFPENGIFFSHPKISKMSSRIFRTIGFFTPKLGMMRPARSSVLLRTLARPEKLPPETGPIHGTRGMG